MPSGNGHTTDVFRLLTFCSKRQQDGILLHSAQILIILLPRCLKESIKSVPARIYIPILLTTCTAYEPDQVDKCVTCPSEERYI